jgi:hypothetical protein
VQRFDLDSTGATETGVTKFHFAVSGEGKRSDDVYTSLIGFVPGTSSGNIFGDFSLLVSS